MEPKLPPGVDRDRYVHGTVLLRQYVATIMAMFVKRKAPVLLGVSACCRVAGKLGARCDGVTREKFAHDALEVMVGAYDDEAERLRGD